MIRVLHIFKTYRTETAGGIEEVIRKISYGCLPYGIKPKVLALSKNKISKKLDGEVEVFLYPLDFSFASTGFSFKGFFAFRKLAKEADIIHYHFPWPIGDLMQFVFRPKKPYIVSYHSDIVKQKILLRFYSPLMKWFLNRAEVIVPLSPNYLESSKILTHYKNKTRVITFGIDENLEKKPSQEIIDKVTNIVGDNKFFLFVGMLRYYKGLHYLLEANANTDFPIVIAGTGSKEVELKAQAKSLGLKNTIFLGLVSDEEKNALYDLCYGFVFPSHLRSEAFGISLLEAAMYGKPLISCEIGTGMSYININGETGLTIPPQDPVALGDAMKYLWDNPHKAEEMGRAARIRYENVFTAEKMTSEFVKLYKSVAK